METARIHWWLRRLHSLSGIVPVGAFFVQHMAGNVLVILGAKEYDHHVQFLLDLPFLVLLEAATIWAPIAFHATLGLVYTFNSKWNPRDYAYQRNWMYVMQRITGLIALAFIVIHVIGTRFSFTLTEKENMTQSMVMYFHDNPMLVLFYIIGVAAAAFHFANGLWSFCIMWGITISRKSQQIAFGLFMALGGALFFAGLLSALQLAGWFDISGDTEEIKKEKIRRGEMSGSTKWQAPYMPQDPFAAS